MHINAKAKEEKVEIDNLIEDSVTMGRGIQGSVSIRMPDQRLVGRSGCQA